MAFLRNSIRKLFLVLGCITGMFVLAACDNAEDRAEGHYQSALELIEAGDFDRAIVEFRNVFKLNGEHREARSTFAAMHRELGNYRESIGQYLRLVEQFPDDLPGNLALAEMFAEIGNWDDMDRFVTKLQDLAPDNQTTRALTIINSYHQAVTGRDPDAATEAAQKAVALQEELPDYIMLRQVVIDDEIRRGDFEASLKSLDAAIEIEPNNPGLYAVRLSVLAALGDGLAIEEQLKDNIDRFPDDTQYRTALVRFYITQQQIDEAEAFLRAAIVPDDTDPTARLTLLRFLTELRGNEVALAELDAMIAMGDVDPVFRSLRAGIVFEMGDFDRAIEDSRILLSELERNEEFRRIQVHLARMLRDTGDIEGSSTLVDEILAEDPSQVDALKMKAEWQIADDLTGDAIVGLRTALDQDPNDPEIFTLLARAHDRDGNQELVAEMLSLAVEKSDQAPEQSLRYARHLISFGNLGPAESILIDALRRAPTNHEVLYALGRTYLGLQEWGRLEQIIATLRNLNSDEALVSANDLQAQMLSAQERSGDAVAFLEKLVAEGAAGFDASVSIVRAYLGSNEPERAKAYLAAQLEKTPNDNGLRFLDGAVDTNMGNLEAAEATYRAILEDDPTEIRVWLGLFRMMTDSGRTDEAARIVDQSLEAVPDAATMKWVKASLLENDGDIAGAVAIYEDLYASDSNNMVIANNLASLLVTLSPDADTVNRAFIIARRLRGSDVPAYQDTYGWLSYLRGDFVEAARTLEPAATALPGNPQVQYHYAKALLAIDRTADARARFETVLAMVEPADTRPFVQDTRAELEKLTPNATDQ